MFFNHETLKTRHIFCFFFCFLALKHFFIKVAMQRVLKTLRNYSLPLTGTLFSKLLVGEEEGETEQGAWPNFGPSLSVPLCCFLLSFSFLGAEMAFLSSVGPTHGKVPPCFVLRLCGFSGSGISDIQKGWGATAPTTAGRDFCGVHTWYTADVYLTGGHCRDLRMNFPGQFCEYRHIPSCYLAHSSNLPSWGNSRSFLFPFFFISPFMLIEGRLVTKKALSIEDPKLTSISISYLLRAAGLAQGHRCQGEALIPPQMPGRDLDTTSAMGKQKGWLCFLWPALDAIRRLLPVLLVG